MTNFPDNLKITPRIIAGYIIQTLLFVIVVGLGYYGIQRADIANDIARRREMDATELIALQSSLFETYACQASLIISKDQIFIGKFRESIDKLREHIKIAREAVDTPEEIGWFVQLDRSVEFFENQFFEKIVPAQQSGATETLQQLDAQTTQLLAETQITIQKLKASYESEANEAIMNAKNIKQQTLWVMVITTIIVIICNMGIGLFLTRSITQALQPTSNQFG